MTGPVAAPRSLLARRQGLAFMAGRPAVSTARNIALGISLGVAAGCTACTRPLEDGSNAVTSGADMRADVPFTAEIVVSPAEHGHPARPMIAGSNMQWVDGGDDLVARWSIGGVPAAPGLARFDPRLANAIATIRPGSLRYPGGTHADVYQWRQGLGPLETRGSAEHAFRRTKQPVLFGTAEFLTLCAQVDAEPLITVNMASGSAEESAAWVRAINVTGLASAGAPLVPGASPALPPGTPRRVRYWELGNEPYLREERRPELTRSPAEFAARAAATAMAMRKVDSSILLGVPLRLDRLGTLPLVHFPGFADSVLARSDLAIDFVALHNAYLPLVYRGGAGGASPSDAVLFRASMAASRVVSEDLEAVRRAWRRHRGKVPLSIAITEYSAMYTLGGALDRHVESLGAALYLADVLRVLASAPDVIMANHWSLNGNAVFGSITPDGVLRPSGVILRAYRDALRGQVVPVKVNAPTVSTPAVGAVPSFPADTVVSAFASRDALNGAVRVLLLNKSATGTGTVRIDAFDSGRVRVTEARVLGAGTRSPFEIRRADEVPWRPMPTAIDGHTVRVTLPPASFATIVVTPVPPT